MLVKKRKPKIVRDFCLKSKLLQTPGAIYYLLAACVDFLCRKDIYKDRNYYHFKVKPLACQNSVRFFTVRDRFYGVKSSTQHQKSTFDIYTKI